MHTHKLVLFFLLLSFTGFSQTATDTILASQYYQKADSLLTDRKLDSSIVYFKKALPIYEKAKAWERLAGCYNRISENQWRNRQLENSFRNSKKALDICSKYLSKEHKEEANAYDNLGNYYENIPDYNQAQGFYEKALKIRKKIFPNDHPDIAISYTNLGVLYNTLSEYKKSLKFHKEALKICTKAFGIFNRKVGVIYNNIGYSYDYLGEFEKALTFYKKNLEIQINIYEKNNINIGYTYTNIGNVYFKKGYYDKTLDNFEKALSIFEENKNNAALSVLYNNLGSLYLDKGEYDIGLKYHLRGLNIRHEIYGKNHPFTANSYMNLGSIHSDNQENNKALEYYNKALKIYQSVYKENNYRIVTAYMNIGGVYRNKEEYKNAEDYYNKALKLCNTIFDENHLKIANVYGELSELYLKKEIFEKALEYNKLGLSILGELYEEQDLINISFYNRSAIIYNKQNKQNKSILFFEKALKANSSVKFTTDLKNTLDLSQHSNLKMLAETLNGKTETLKLQYFENNNLKYLNESLLIYQKLDLIIDNIRNSFQNYKDKVFFAENGKQMYTEAIKTNLLLNKETRDKSLLFKAFHYSEKSKANTLKDLISDSNAKSFSGLSPNLLELEKSLRIDKAYYQSNINEELSNKEIDSTKLSTYENKLFDISRKQDSLTAVLENNYPKYHELKYNNDAVSVDKIQQQLDKQTTLLEFFTADSITYAFTISKNKMDVKELTTPKLTEQIEQLRTTITDKNTKTYKTQSYKLYKTLIEPIKDQLIGENLIVIPDGPLWHLNFDLLLTQDDSSNNPKELSYLLKEYVISYANSATLFFAEDKTSVDTQQQQEECLAFSFSDSTNIVDASNMSLATLRDTGDDLPGTRKEIKAIADIIDGNYYYGSEAVEANFKKNASRYNILHLALHGEVDNERPENSKLYFTKNKDSIEDNLLYAHELFAIDIPAELTVLSACNTGTGKIAKGEGIMSLGTAFQYAGTKSLLLSSWEVSDQTTPELMKYFYTNLKEGMNKAKALQQAKLLYLNTADFHRTHPFYWGGFYLVGDTTPIPFSSNNYLYWVLGFSVLLWILLGLFWYRRKSKN